MTQRKRIYVPKIKGCYECARRRIDCDGLSPNCLKCERKGIQCSGYGFRFKVIKTAQINSKHVRKQSLPNQTLMDTTIDAQLQDVHERVGVQFNHFDLKEYSSRSDVDHAIAGTLRDSEKAETLGRQTSAQHKTRPIGSIPCAPLNCVNPTEQQLLLYFSEKIAPILVLIDDQYNGWRRIVLPLAHSNELILNAVISTATFGLSACSCSQTIRPNLAYQVAISKLRDRQNLHARGEFEKQCVMLALLVLLAGNIVKGSSDFRAILRLIEAFSSAVDDDRLFTNGELGNFLSTQIPKFRGYASPFLSQQEAVEILGQTVPPSPFVSKGWTEYLMFCRLYPDLSFSMSVIYQVNQKACDIYFSRLTAGPNSPALENEVEDFIRILKELPIDSPGEPSLMWSVFIAALESSDLKQRQFLMDFLIRQHRRYGFAYVAKAMDYLKTEWTEQDHGWVWRLTQLEWFVV